MRGAGYLPLALLFLASVLPSNADSTDLSPTGADDDAADVDALSAHGEPGAQDVWYDVRGPITVSCGGAQGTVQWSINGTKLEDMPEAQRKRWLDNGTAIHVARSTEDDFGNYSCEFGGERRAFFVRGRVKARLPENVNVVEEQNLRVTCRLIGKPYPAVRWSYANDSADSNNTVDVADAFGDRVTLETSPSGVRGGVLALSSARRSDAGWLHCTPLGGSLAAHAAAASVSAAAAAAPAIATSQLRVKDMYAALWPFLGICAEVLVLCAVILLYERRRTKPDLDDSDTDNHDQKKS